MALSIRAEPQFIDLDEVPFWVHDLIYAQYPYVVTLSILVYDSVITMDQEVKYFWRIPQNAVDVLYFINRYIAIFGSAVSLLWNSFGTNPAECTLSAWMPGIYSWVNVTLMDYLLTVRVLALYSQDKRLSICLKTIFYLDASLTCAFILYVNSKTTMTVAILAEGITVCTYADQDNSLLVIWLSLITWIIPIAYGTILMILAVYKGMTTWKMATRLRGVPLVRILIRDQLVYFVFALTCCTVNLVQQIGVASNYVQEVILINLGSINFLSILGSRMLYNTKDAAAKRENIGTEFRLTRISIGEIEFADMRSNANERRNV